jgi:hypothetical protein
MNFSVCQWLSIVILDLFIRSVLLVVVSLNILIVPIALILSIIYLWILGFVGACTKTLNLRPQTSMIVTCAVSNILFLALENFTSIAIGRTVHLTQCYNYECRWVDGSITWLGIQGLAIDSFAALVANIIPVLLVYLHSVHCREKTA